MSARQGFTLIELLITTTVLSILIVAITSMVQMAVVEAGKSRVVLTATMLAQDRIEAARNAPYASVGTVGGIPEGIFLAAETVEMNGLNFDITTNIIYVDDPFDGLAPEDTSPTDYKRMRVAVRWGGMFAVNEPVVMATDISSNVVESDDGGGTLAITVFNALGEPVPQASLTIQAPELEPPVNTILETNELGVLVIPGAKPCIECYRISAGKTGYTSDRTHGREEVANPTKPHISVFQSAVSTTSFTIDVPSTVTFRAVRTAEYGFNSFQGVNFRLRGTKEIGRTALDLPVYKTDISLTTGTGGLISRNNLEWDTYIVEIPGGSTVDLAASSPFTPFPVYPNSTSTFTLVVTANTPHTLLVRVMNHLLEPVASASVELKNDLIGYIATQSTGIGGNPDRAQTHFSNLPSTNTPFTLKIEALDFETVVSEATVSGDMIEDYLVNPL
jgi:prepilin-type N-terminal cleavage/methylation domain-containing protein